MNEAYETNWTSLGLNPAMGKTAFDWKFDPEPEKKPTRAEKNREWSKAYFKSHYVPVAQRTKELTEFKGPVHNYGCMSETPQDRAKTARLVGRNNGARSQ